MRPVLHGALDLPETVAGYLEQGREHDRPEGQQAKQDQRVARSLACREDSMAQQPVKESLVRALGIEDLGIADLGIENSVLI
jgi:hypothetical protein